MTAADLRSLADALDRLTRYEALLESLVGRRAYIYRCEKCGEFAAAERKTRRFCEECGR